MIWNMKLFYHCNKIFTFEAVNYLENYAILSLTEYVSI